MTSTSILSLLVLYLCVSHSFQVMRISPIRIRRMTEMSAEPEKPKFTFSKLIQLIGLGAGAPMLGEFKEIDENGKMMFELEANNLVDSEGNSLQTKAKYFRDGYVEEKNEMSPPGFWSNLISGGKLQGEWEAKVLSNKIKE